MEYPPNAAFLSFALRYPPFGTVALPSSGAPPGDARPTAIIEVTGLRKKEKTQYIDPRPTGPLGVSDGSRAASVASGIGGRACPRAPPPGRTRSPSPELREPRGSPAAAKAARRSPAGAEPYLKPAGGGLWKETRRPLGWTKPSRVACRQTRPRGLERLPYSRSPTIGCPRAASGARIWPRRPLT